MKKYIKIRHSLYEVVDLTSGIFVAALAVMLASAVWLSLDWLCRNQISAWAVVGLITGTAVAGTITVIFSDFNGRKK